MKKANALVMSLILVLTLFTACGKEDAPVEVQEAPASTTLPVVEAAEPVETTAETTEETEPPTEPGPNPIEIIIGSEIYTMPVHSAELVNNGWEIECYNNPTFEEINSKHVWFTRDGFVFDADLEGTVGGSVYDSNVIIDTAFFYSEEDSAFAAVAGSIYPCMAYGDLMPALDSVGYEEIEVFEKGDNGHVVCAYHEDYRMEIHCSSEQVSSMIVVD